MKKVIWILIIIAAAVIVYFLPKGNQLVPYTNPVYGYSFEYVPINFYIAEESPEAVGVNSNENNFWVFHVRVRQNEDQHNMTRILEDWQSRRIYNTERPDDEYDIDISDVTVADRPAKYITIANVGNYGNAAVIFVKGDLIFTLSGDDSIRENKQIFLNFLKSFEFK